MTGVHITPQLRQALENYAKGQTQVAGCEAEPITPGEVVEAALWEFFARHQVYVPVLAPQKRKRRSRAVLEAVQAEGPRTTPLRQPKDAA